ncbi:TetR/AcrR family transcriptional regulator [Frankia sp. CNm7]|uniref:TetR/AcrR family transcriptional regulator n=1 Tax=Frankia nepalensis TaxID=1836974 RepID=A0A937RBP7_9ACTN|nr:TetR/AcrR family transcriptional regulator [Frankia nepalensis]MBL7497157.1 TetR/AcrR family transcriptional regulator [Frankia nepalensis]MBL7513099.1 TetR/AcrR family transcriptional regulator [Frankia nepalensis]MBL7524424.1 TetR/AcrR family transcriptional regulator [Frankia nepalensis]MBL7626862.1 TetR/AcrR family transcriptional regulator [Frankia nepalensis]
MPAPQPLDRRIRRTRSALERALLDLIAERDLVQISVSDVTKRADVNRTTFYEHYTDVHDLAASACTAMFDELIATSPVIAPSRAPARQLREREALVRVLTHIRDRARLYRALLGEDGSARVINHLQQRLAISLHVNLTRPGAGTHADDPAEIPYDPTAALLAGALLGLVLDWLRHGCPGTPEHVCATIWPRLARTERPGDGPPEATDQQDRGAGPR